MKIILSVLGATAMLAAMMLHTATASAPVSPSDTPIRVVAGPAPVMTLPTDKGVSMTTASAAAAALPATISAATGFEPDPTPMNTAQTDEPFASQQRNPEWAGPIEAAVAEQLPSGGAIACAEFMCKATIPLADANGGTGQGDVDSADQRAVLATKAWPTDIAYNRQTARIVRDAAGASLTFFVTRTQWADEE